MPITRSHFELGISPEIEALMRKLSTFFEEHKDEAFSFEELWREEFGDAPIPRAIVLFHLARRRAPSPYQEAAVPREQRKFVYALFVLVDHGVIQEREVGGAHYYAKGRIQLTQVFKS